MNNTKPTASAASRPSMIRGLGDVVAVVAQPIAKAIDRVAGTKIQGCNSCQRRRAALNKAVPFGG